MGKLTAAQRAYDSWRHTESIMYLLGITEAADDDTSCADPYARGNDGDTEQERKESDDNR